LADPEGSPTRVIALRPSGEPRTLVLAISGPIAPADLPDLCEHVRGLLEGSDADLVVCDVRGLVDPDAVTIDALARLQLTARRQARRIRLTGACAELEELLGLMGLSEAVPLTTALPLEPSGQTEEREQARGVEEEARPGDQSP
jgi:ABC-type transporter Mla MlaB component